jgi:hypothetical protein
MKTTTHKVCEQASMLGLPISRTSQHVAKYTRKWKAERSWWDPEQESKGSGKVKVKGRLHG